MIASYRKVHLPHVGVDRWVDRGDRPYAVHQVGEARVGLAICYDCSFPEPMRRMGLAGADVIALPTNWPIAAARTAEIVPPARSMENHLYFVAANRVGTERGFQYCGLSSICGPTASNWLAPKDEETMLFAESIWPRHATSGSNEPRALT
jgi:5-aminopentanamidase